MSLDPQHIVEEFRQALGGDAPPPRPQPQENVRPHERLTLLASLLKGMDTAVKQRCGQGGIEVSDARAEGPDAVALSASLTKPGRSPLDMNFAIHGDFIATTGLDPRDDHDVLNPARQSVYRNAQFGMLLNQVKDAALIYFGNRRAEPGRP